MDKAIVGVDLFDFVELFGGDDETGSEVTAGGVETTAADSDGEFVVFLGKLVDETEKTTNVLGVFRDSNEARFDFENGAIDGIGVENRILIKNIAGNMAIEINSYFIHESHL